MVAKAGKEGMAYEMTSSDWVSQLLKLPMKEGGLRNAWRAETLSVPVSNQSMSARRKWWWMVIGGFLLVGYDRVVPIHFIGISP